MDLQVKPLLIGGTVLFFSGAAISYYITRNQTPVKTITKTEIVEKIVYKEVETKKKDVKKKTDKVTTIVKNVDGSSTTTVVDKTIVDSNENSSKVISSESDKKEKSASATSFEKDWRVGVKTDLNTRIFEASAGRRLLWGIWGEVSYNTEVKKPLVGLSVEF